MSLDFLRVGLLTLTLASACAVDVSRRRIPNAVTLPSLLLGLALAAVQGGLPRLCLAIGGLGVASVALLAYAGRMLGAGDIKLFWAVGALTGPHFMGLAVPASALAGGVLGAAWVLRRGGPKIPYALAIALGVGLTVWLRGGVEP